MVGDRVTVHLWFDAVNAYNAGTALPHHGSKTSSQTVISMHHRYSDGGIMNLEGKHLVHTLLGLTEIATKPSDPYPSYLAGRYVRVEGGISTPEARRKWEF